MMNKRTSLHFVIFALIALLSGITAGLLGGIQYISPTFLKEILPFNQLRSVHVTSVISWIILAAMGGIYYYICDVLNNTLFSNKLAKIHIYLYIGTGIAIYISLFSGKMGGREYMTFHPALMIPVLAGWVLFAVNFFFTLRRKPARWPVYLWMWGTGIVFMIFHLCEANLWIFHYFRSDYIRDLTVQWKSYGSFTGSYNLLVYGTAIYLMSKIKGESQIAFSKTAFFFYFLGLANLMFGWAHHIYPVPSMPWIRIVAYAISMTEWIVLANLIITWTRSLSAEEKNRHFLPYRMLVVTDYWILINVFIALLMSIPAINHFTHGSHVTVAHAMGTTIGIDTTILLASCLYLISRYNEKFLHRKQKLIRAGMALFNVSLALFLCCFIVAGIIKGQWQYASEGLAYNGLMTKLKPFFILILAGGSGLFTGIVMMAVPIIKGLILAKKSI